MIRTFAIATAAIALMGGAAFAADLSVPETPYVPESTGFSWDGLYAGVGVGGYFEDGYDTQASISGVVGVNAVIADPWLIGAELEAAYFLANDDFIAGWEIWLKARAGVLATPDVLLYGVAGVAASVNEIDETGTVYGIGAGIEAAVSDSISIRGEALAVKYDDDTSGIEAKASILFHF